MFQFLLQRFALQPSALPGGIVRILHLQFRERRRLTLCKRVIERNQLSPDNDFARGFITGDVVNIQ